MRCTSNVDIDVIEVNMFAKCREQAASSYHEADIREGGTKCHGWRGQAELGVHLEASNRTHCTGPRFY